MAYTVYVSVRYFRVSMSIYYISRIKKFNFVYSNIDISKFTASPLLTIIQYTQYNTVELWWVRTFLTEKFSWMYQSFFLDQGAQSQNKQIKILYIFFKTTKVVKKKVLVARMDALLVLNV